MDMYQELSAIKQKGYDEKYEFFQRYAVETPDVTIGELLEDFFERAKADGEILDYTTDYASYDDGPGYECGTIFMAWVTSEGKLQSTSYEWEAM